MDSSLLKPPPKLACGGNTYTQLSSEQQSNIYEELFKRRHSIDILRMERHVLENEELPPSIAKKPGLGLQDFAAAPNRYSSIERRKAVAIDCEWGKAESRRKELLAICAIDVLTGETLIESLVVPSQPIEKWRENAHGITQSKIDAAVQRQQCLRGWKEAREKLFEHVDGETILIGYTIGGDLELLRLFHTTIVDSQVLATSAVYAKQWGKKARPKWPMPKVCSNFLGMPINQNTIFESCTESVLEKALAAREIALQCIQRPKDFEEWARQSRIEFWKPHNEKNARNENGGRKKGKEDKNAKKTGNSDTNPDKKMSAGPISDKNQATTTFSQGYEAGYQAAYQAAFQSGFQIGYARGLEKANIQGDGAMINNMGQSQYEDKHSHQESTRYTNEEDSFYDPIGTSSQDGSCDDDWAPA